jgi:hypothetical protein
VHTVSHLRVVEAPSGPSLSMSIIPSSAKELFSISVTALTAVASSLLRMWVLVLKGWISLWEVLMGAMPPFSGAVRT